MNPRILLATARRVLTQLRHDPRSVGLMVLVPSLLMVLLRYVFNSGTAFDRFAPALLAFFPFLLMFLTTSVTMQRERTSGTLERLLTTPAGKLDLLGGYGIAFSVVSVMQVALAVLVSVWLGLSIAGSFAAACLIGVSDIAGKYYAPELGAFMIYLVMVLVLMWRPAGLFGKR